MQGGYIIYETKSALSAFNNLHIGVVFQNLQKFQSKASAPISVPLKSESRQRFSLKHKKVHVLKTVEAN